MKTDKGYCTGGRNVNDICDDILINQINAKVAIIKLKSDVCDDEVELVLNNYEIVTRGDKTYAVKKKLKYPKTYEECCGVLGMTFDYPDIRMVSNNEYNLYSRFIELIRCRDAYWKIADNWKPDWKDDSDKYFICYLKDEVWMSNIRDCNRLLVFPTEEMRDAFFENFKDLIEQCKKLL